MNSIHFHFNGDVNINLSLPDSADRPGYKKLVDSLEDYLHDAAEEAAVTEAEADSIVMVMRPDKTPEVMQETSAGTRSRAKASTTAWRSCRTMPWMWRGWLSSLTGVAS